MTGKLTQYEYFTCTFSSSWSPSPHFLLFLSAVDGCAYVMHIASPFPKENPGHEDELIKPAVEGTTSVLRACQKAKVKRVVLTSSMAAVQGCTLNRLNNINNYSS